VAVILIRHGESEGNVSKRFQGRQDTKLTARGEQQAQAAGAWLAQREGGIQRIYCSPLKRAHHTAQIIHRQLGGGGIGLELEPDVMEYAAGKLEGLGREEIDAQYPEYAQRGLGARGDFADWGGESYDDMQARLRRHIRRIEDRHWDEDVAVVAHGGCLYQLLKLWCGWPTPRQFFIRMTNCCMAKLELREVSGVNVAELQWFVPLELATGMVPEKKYVEI
jgi:probable phosphoglycerate mutase